VVAPPLRPPHHHRNLHIFLVNDEQVREKDGTEREKSKEGKRIFFYK
jgi:hypothetical protein